MPLQYNVRFNVRFTIKGMVTSQLGVKRDARCVIDAAGMVWYGMVEVCEGAPVAVSGWVLADRHDVRPCAASSLHRGTISVSNIIGGTGTLG